MEVFVNHEKTISLATLKCSKHELHLIYIALRSAMVNYEELIKIDEIDLKKLSFNRLNELQSMINKIENSIHQKQMI